MKNATILTAVILLSLTASLFSQEEAEKKQETLKPALLVIDIQNDYMKMVPERDQEVAIYMINAYIDLFRKHGLPVIRVYHYSKEYGPEQGTEGFEFPGTVNITPDDPKVIKTYPDAFNKTELDRVIRDSGSNTLFLTGLSAVGCVLATWIGAQNHDYHAFLVKDAIMSHDSGYTDQVEQMFEAVGYDVVSLIVENAE